jgi:hypothetical protein
MSTSSQSMVPAPRRLNPQATHAARDRGTQQCRVRALVGRGAALVVLGEMLIVYLYFNPGWIALTDRLLQP